MTKDDAIKKLLNSASGEVGYKAKAGKENKYAEYLTKLDYYNGPKWAPGWGCDWCDIFVDYMFLKVFGNPIGRQMIYQPEKSLGAGCGFSAGYYSKNNAWSTTPEVGAQGFLGTANDIYHTGIVESFNSSSVTMIEGNAGGGDGQVMRVTRSRKDFYGFGIPNWSLVVNEAPTPDRPDLNKKIDALTYKLGELAKGVLQGKYGNGGERVKKLGAYYDAVQFIVNEVLK